ncbi:MAG: hypothetical protein QOH91_440 [Mycobacterium sp.]|nr:hypothetical protein [Mycobacterium sp.]
MGRLPHAWIAPPATRELRELVRHRAKLVAIRSSCEAEVHAVLAKRGVWVPMSDLFGVEGTLLLDTVELPGPYKGRMASLRRLIESLDFEIDLFTKLARGRLAKDPGYTAIQQIPGIGAVLAAVFVAEIGDVHRFAGPSQLASWAGLTPRHHESDTTVHRGRITKQGLALGAVGGDRVGENPAGHQLHRRCPRKDRAPSRQPQHRGRGRRPKTVAAGLLWVARPPGACPAARFARGMTNRSPVGAGRAGHDPRYRRGRPSD